MPGERSRPTPATLSVGENSDLGHVLIYPNPWDTRKHTGTPLHFSGLPDGSTIKIFTLSAHWVRTLTPSGGHADWDLTNDSGARRSAAPVSYSLFHHRHARPEN